LLLITAVGIIGAFGVRADEENIRWGIAALSCKSRH